jgi:hypothetical protein
MYPSKNFWGWVCMETTNLVKNVCIKKGPN